MEKRKNGKSRSDSFFWKLVYDLASFSWKQLRDVFVKFFSLVVLAILSIALAYHFGSSIVAGVINSSSPWNQQRDDIRMKNNIRDAYSSIIGSDVGIISQNGFVKWFSSKEAKEIDISIPKLVNYSPLFDDDSNRNQLKTAFENSINHDTITQSTSVYKIFYDGSKLGEWENGKKVSSFRDLSKAQKKDILEDLQKRIWNTKNIKFKEWEKIGNQDNVDFEFKPSSNKVTIRGKFRNEGTMGLFKKTYRLIVEYDFNNEKWSIINKSLKVEEAK